MRYLIFILLLLPVFSNAQNSGLVIKTGAANQATIQKGATGADSVTLMGVMDTARAKAYLATGANSLRLIGRVVMNSSDSTLYLYNGLGWVRVGTGGTTIDTTGLSDRIAYNLTRIDGLSDTASLHADTLEAHKDWLSSIESEIAAIPIVDTTNIVQRLDNLSDSAAAAADSINNLRVAVDGKEPIISPGTTDQYWQGDKTWQPKSGLPISTATQAALDYLDSTAYIGKPVNVQRVMIEGQSNCNGSDVDTGSLKIPPLIENQFELLDTFERVYTWDYTNNVYKKLKAGVTNYGRTTNSFGSELSFAARWEKNNPDGILVIDKKCLYGQTIDMFQKGSVQYTTILDDRPLADEWLKDRGYRVKNTAWIYIQGESDYLSAGYEYLAELNQLVSDKMSDGLIDSATRIVISQVSTSAPLYGAGVDSAQVAFVNAAPNRKLINNDANTLGVGNHYDAAGYVQLGLSTYTQAFDADSLKTLDEFMHQPGIGTVIGEVRVENVEGDAAAAQAVVGAPAAFTVVGDNTTKYPFIVGSKTGAAVNSNLMWFVAGGQPIGTVFAAAAPALLIRAVAGTSLGLGANNRNADITIQSATGNVGVGVGINPVSKFDVLGSIRGRDTIFALGNIYGNGLPRGKQDSVIYKGANGRFYIGAGYVDSVKKSNDSFFYYKGVVRTFIGLDNSGSGSGIDSVRISGDTLYQCSSGTCTFVGVVNSGGGGSGTVTNFTFTDGNGFDGTVTNSTTTPTLSIDLQADHNFVSDAELTNFTAAYNDKINSGAFSGGQLTLTQQDAGIVTATINDATTSVKGIASFNASDFDVSSGAVSTDYTNGQAASGSTKGFLTSADWTTFNNKQAALGFTAVPDTRTVNGQALSSNVTLDIDDVAPTQTGNANKILTTDGTNATWQAPAVGVTINTQSGTTYTLLSSDNGKVVEFTNSSAVTVTVPTGLGTSFTCIIRQNGTGDVTLSASGTTINNANSHTSTRAQYSAFAIISTSTANTFITQGDMD